jgi:hypothetical protein
MRDAHRTECSICYSGLTFRAIPVPAFDLEARRIERRGYFVRQLAAQITLEVYKPNYDRACSEH